MDIWQLDKIFLFIAFVVPGFLSLKTYQTMFPGEIRSTADLLIDIVSYSAINYALLAIPIIQFEAAFTSKSQPVLYFSFYAFVVFAAPVIWVIALKALRTTQFFQKHVPHPTLRAWDYVFSQRKPFWLRITLKNGDVLSGLYSSRSFASSSPAPDQIYLEESWVVTDAGKFVRRKNRTAGVLIAAGEISHIEFRTA